MFAWLACTSAPVVRLPAPEGPLAPSELRWRGDAQIFADTARCASCHPEAAAGWSTSAHAHASFDNPWYRSSVDVVRREEGNRASRHCAGCHDPALLITGAMDHDVDPADPLARVGVPCLGCHGASAATSDGNASLTLDLAEIPFPRIGQSSGPAVEAHRDRMRPAPLLSGAVCGSCHRGFLDARTGNEAFLTGLDDLGSHASSAWRGSEARRLEPVPPASAGCVDCHLEGHRFPGGQTSLAAEAGQLPANVAMLQRAVDLHVVAWMEGPDLVVEAIVHNTGTGHAFPGGLGDAQDTWLRLEVLDEAGRSRAEVEGHAVRAEVLDEAGHPERRHRAHRIGVVAWDHRVPPGDARIFRTELRNLPRSAPSTSAERARQPARGARVVAELWHRPHPPELHAAACAVGEPPERSGETPHLLSGCAPRPETRLGSATARVGAPVTFEVAWSWGLGRLHQVSERLPEAREPLDLALQLAPDARSRAAVLVLRGQLEGRLQRTDEALAALSEAEGLVGPHPAVVRARADALAHAWRWEEAAEAYAPLGELAPHDTATWRDLARARISAGDATSALQATARGLLRAPRDAELLRHQAIALQRLDDPRASRALAAWEAHRPRDDRFDRRLACDRDVPGCAEARAPIPVLSVDARPDRRDDEASAR